MFRVQKLHQPTKFYTNTVCDVCDIEKVCLKTVVWSNSPPPRKCLKSSYYLAGRFIFLTNVQNVCWLYRAGQMLNVAHNKSGIYPRGSKAGGCLQSTRPATTSRHTTILPTTPNSPILLNVKEGGGLIKSVK